LRSSGWDPRRDARASWCEMVAMVAAAGGGWAGAGRVLGGCCVEVLGQE